MMRLPMLAIPGFERRRCEPAVIAVHRGSRGPARPRRREGAASLGEPLRVAPKRIGRVPVALSGAAAAPGVVRHELGGREAHVLRDIGNLGGKHQVGSVSHGARVYRSTGSGLGAGAREGLHCSRARRIDRVSPPRKGRHSGRRNWPRRPELTSRPAMENAMPTRHSAPSSAASQPKSNATPTAVIVPFRPRNGYRHIAVGSCTCAAPERRHLKSCPATRVPEDYRVWPWCPWARCHGRGAYARDCGDCQGADWTPRPVARLSH